MASTIYTVEIDLETKGDLGISRLSGGVSRLDGAVAKMSSHGRNLMSEMVGHLDSMVSRAVSFGETVATWGAGIGLAAVTYGVVHLNTELEGTKIALGSIFQANGVASSLPGGMKLAADTIQKMRIDAQKLPGEFEDLRNIFTTVAIPGFQAGANVDQLRDISAKLMATGKIAQMPMDQVAREAGMLMQGRSGAHNILGMKLMGLSGDKAEKFNKLGAPERLKLLNAELDKYKDSIDEFGKSYDGLSSTFVDVGKQVLTIATAPVFDRVKGLLSDINDWAQDNRAEINAWAQHAGVQIALAFDWGVAKIKEWYPAIKAFATNAYDRLKSIWEEAQPYVEKFGAVLKTALQDPGTIDKLITLAKIYAGVKIGGGILSGVEAIGSIGANGSMLGGGLKMAGQAAGAVGSAVSTTAEAASIIGWGPALAGAGEVLVTTFTPALIAAAAAATLFGTYEMFRNMKLEAAAQGQLDSFAAMEPIHYAHIEALSQMNAAEQSATDRLYDFAAALATERLRSGKVAEETAQTVNDFYKFPIISGEGEAERQTKAAADRANQTKHPGGGGGTHIQKVEIVVTTNQEPSRVARIVGDHLMSLSRNPGRSPHVPNYSAR